MAKRKASNNLVDMGGLALSSDEYAKLVNLMDELAFRGPMQEALVVRIANVGGFGEVLTRIKRRRLYKKRMATGEPAGDIGSETARAANAGRKRKKGKKRPTSATSAGGPAGDTEGME